MRESVVAWLALVATYTTNMVTASALASIFITSSVGLVGHTSGVAITFHAAEFNMVGVGEWLASIACWWDGVWWANAFTRLLITESSITGAQFAVRVSIVSSQALVTLTTDDVRFAWALTTELLALGIFTSNGTGSRAVAVEGTISIINSEGED
jgi:hypothetical protein